MRRFSVGIVLFLAGCTSVSILETTTTEPVLEVSTTTSPQHPSTTGPGPSTATTPPTTTTTPTAIRPDLLTIEAYPVPNGSRPHDVAPAEDGGVWYTAQNSGDLGWLDPVTGETRQVDLGSGSRPHGVIVGAEGKAWITDGGLNAIVAVDPTTDEVTTYPLPDSASDSNLNTAAFDSEGILWFTGQTGVYGSLDPTTGEMTVYEAPQGPGPYGITATPAGAVVFASLAGSYVGEIVTGGEVVILGPPTPDQGARRVWSDSIGNLWVAEWNTGQVSRYDTASGEWTTWRLPGDAPAAYAVYVDESDIVWLTDFGGDAIVRFDPETEQFDVYPLPHRGGNVRQLLGRPGEVWGAESAADHLIVIRTR